MTRSSTLAAVALAIAGFDVSDGFGERRQMGTQREGWRSVSVGEVLTFRVPADARERSAQPVDSLAGLIIGPGYEITYDYGRFSERMKAHQGLPGYSVSVDHLGSRRME